MEKTTALSVLLALAALPSLASDATWKGGQSGDWTVSGNWSAYPTSSDYASFGAPVSDPITVTVNDAVDAYAFKMSGSRTADVTLTGSGLVKVYRNNQIVNTANSSSRMIFDVAVTNAANAGGMRLQGNSTFKKDLFIGTDKNFSVGLSTDSSTASMSLEANAKLTALNLTVDSGSSLSMSGSSAICLNGDNKFNVNANASFSASDNATVAAKYMNVGSGASATVADNAQVSLTRDLKVSSGGSLTIADNAQVSLQESSTSLRDLFVYRGGSLTISGNPVIKLRRLFLPFSYAEETDEEWTMGGGEIQAMANSDSYRLEMPYTNATKTVSGTGTLCFYRVGFETASNLVFRLNGPNVYVRKGHISSSAVGYGRTRFEIGGGSTIGAWGADVQFTSWTNRIVGTATVDTTDYSDKTTARTITLGKYYDCDGVLTVKGVGTCALGSPTPEQPNLGLKGTESSTITCSSVYALGDISLNDSASLTASGYLGHKTEESYRNVKSLMMDGSSSLNVGRYVILSGDATFSGNAKAVVQHTSTTDSNPIFSCVNLSLSDDASLSVTGTIAATTLAMSGNAHLAFTAGTAFAAGAEFGSGNWMMEITIPSGYEAGIRPVVMGANFEGDFADHVTLLGDTTGWSAQTIDGNLVLYKEAPPSGIEWIGGSQTSDNWSDSANWNGGNRPTADDFVAFGGLARPTPYNDWANTVSGLVFRASAGPFTLSGSGDLKPTADCSSRSGASAANAAIASHSAFDQTISQFVDFGAHHVYLLSDGGGALKLTGGFTATGNWNYFVVGGDVRIGGTCSVGIFSFKTSTTTTPSCMRILSGGTLTIRNQFFRGLVEDNRYIGRLVVEDGGTMVVQNGDCAFWYGGLENVIDGTLLVQGTGSGIGRLVGGPSEQYYAGSGVIYADSARSARSAASASHYINFGGTLKLYMNGDWYTATYMLDNGEGVMQNPNHPTRFRMKDGTTLGATADWAYGPMADASDVIAVTNTPADRASIMVGNVTVNTQNPTNDTAHTITFVDPLDASEANLVKAGSGTLVFNETAGYPSQVSNLTVNAGSVRFTGAAPTVGGVTVNGGEVRFGVMPTTLRDMIVGEGATASFAAAPALTGTLTIASKGANFRVDELVGTMTWVPIATAADIVGPDGETKWNSANEMCRFKIVADGTGKTLYSAKASCFMVIVR